MKDVDRAFAGRGGNHAGLGIIDIRVHAVPDRKCLTDHFAGIGIHHNEQLRTAGSDKEPPVFAVHCDGDGLAGRRDLPSRFDYQFAGIDGNYLVRVFEVVVDRALAIGYGLLRSTTQWNRAEDRSLGWIHTRGIFATSVEHKETLGCRIIKNRVGVTAGLDLTENFESLQIKDDDLTGITVRDEPAAEIIEGNDAVATLQIGNGANDSGLVGIDYFDLTAMRE